jgi:hypothetical protein
VISIVIPTVTGREEHLARCISAYEQRTRASFELIVLTDRATCGVAWQEGADQANGDFLHFTADDLEPHDSWDTQAIVAVGIGSLPAPLIDQGAAGRSCGEHWRTIPAAWTEVRVTGVPFCNRRQWKKIGPMLPIHYFTDNWFSDRGRLAGYPTVACPDYRLTHHWAQPGRGAGTTQDQRMADDKAAYLDAGGTL